VWVLVYSYAAKISTFEKCLYPNETFAQLWSHGFVDVKRIDKTDNLGAYLYVCLTDLCFLFF